MQNNRTLSGEYIWFWAPCFRKFSSCCFLLETQVMQWINKYGWSLLEDGTVYIANQEDNIKTKNITEKITFESKFFF